MKTDSVLEELYRVRADIMRRAGNDFDTYFAQRRERQQANEALHPDVNWVDFSNPKRHSAVVPANAPSGLVAP
jgi:hypothetical protein